MYTTINEWKRLNENQIPVVSFLPTDALERIRETVQYTSYTVIDPVTIRFDDSGNIDLDNTEVEGLERDIYLDWSYTFKFEQATNMLHITFEYEAWHKEVDWSFNHSATNSFILTEPLEETISDYLDDRGELNECDADAVTSLEEYTARDDDEEDEE